MREFQIIIYGSYGYTGKLIIEECKENGLGVLLSGRNGEKLSQQSQETGYPFETVEIQDQQALERLLAKGHLVIHCGGPFIHTAEQMLFACMNTQTHYTDITGEYPVFEKLAGYDAQSREKEILVMPGVGFDVVPSDCLAVHLGNRMSDASHLELAFAMSKGRMSRGTNKTMTEGLGYGGKIRKNGTLISTKIGHDVKEINFGPFTRKAMCIPWGDISTAWRSTGIDNIKVYMAVPDRMIRSAQWSNWFGWFLRLGWVKNYLLKRSDSLPAGPGKETREKGRSYLWGKVRNAAGSEIEARLEVPNGYLLTAKSAVLIAKKILADEVKPGYFTPAQYFGENLILDVKGTSFL